MASPPRPWAAIVATGMLIAAPAAAETPDPAASSAPAPPVSAPAAPAAPATTAPAAPPPPAGPAAAPARRGPPARPFVRPRRGVPPKPHGDIIPAEGTPIASSPTFTRLEDGKSRIFMEVSHKVEVVESRTPGRVVYRLRGAVVVQRTNQLALPTGFFTTPVNRVQLVQQGPDLDLVIELRETTDLAYHVIETPRGMALWIDFPRAIAYGRDDGPAEPSRPRARRGTTTQRIGGAASDDAPPTDDN